MADIEYTRTPEAFQLTTNMGGVSAPGIGNVGSLFEELLRRKLAQQEAARTASYVQPPPSIFGANRGPSQAEMDDQTFKREQQELQLRAMKQQLYNQERERHQANLSEARYVRNVGGAGYQPQYVATT